MKVGEGGEGDVYSVRDTKTNSIKVIKLFKESSPTDETPLKRTLTTLEDEKFKNIVEMVSINHESIKPIDSVLF